MAGCDSSSVIDGGCLGNPGDFTVATWPLERIPCPITVYGWLCMACRDLPSATDGLIFSKVEFLTGEDGSTRLSFAGFSSCISGSYVKINNSNLHLYCDIFCSTIANLALQ